MKGEQVLDNYVCYHLHTENSLLDSCTNYKLYVDKAVALGQRAIAFTEHGNIYNWIEKKMYCDAKGIKYIHGCEIYLTEQLEPKVRDNYHTILLAKNEDGRKELNLLVGMATNPDHFYYKPRLSFEEFFNISDNIIKISACLASPLRQYPGSLVRTDEMTDEEYQTEVTKKKKVFSDLLSAYDYYEIQPHVKSREQILYNQFLYKASQEYHKPLIAATDTHSLDEYKQQCRKILLLAKNITFTNEEEFDLTYKSYDELVEMFRQQGSLSMDVILDAINNTNVMADSIEDFQLDPTVKYPRLYPTQKEEELALRKRIVERLKYKLEHGIIKAENLDKYKANILEEMKVFKQIDMTGFMLFMSDLISWCWDNGIPTGFCRGSVGGSTVAFITDIIDLDPVVWNTVFSRFANIDRKEVGD